MEKEIWKEIPNTNGIYYVSNLGKVKSITHTVKCSSGKTRIQYGRILKLVNSKGYLRVSFKVNDKRINLSAHRLVAIAFIENKNNYPQVNHINGIKKDNRVENLEWCTNQYNQIHAVKNNLINHNYGEKHHMAKLKNSDIEIIISRINNGEKMNKIAIEKNMSTTAISNIYNKKTYINLK